MTYNSNLHIFPELCVKYLKEKFHLGELNIRELMYVMKRIGIKTFKVHINGSVYDVFLRRDVNGVQDFEFINTLVLHRKEKRIKDEWAKEPITDYTPEMSNMKNASDELLQQDDVYYINENNKNNMKAYKKKLYESIMASVAKEVKKVLNEDGFRRVNPIKKKYDYLVYAISIGKVSPLTGKTKFGWSIYEDRSVELELYLVSNESGSRCTILFGAPGSLKLEDHIEIVDNDTMRRTNGQAGGELEVIDICKANREDFYRMAKEYDYFTEYEQKYGYSSYYTKRIAKKWAKLGVWYSIKGVE